MDKTYCIFGDSVTQAAYIKDSWVNQARMFLESKYSNDIVNVFNLGVGGNTSDDLLERIDELKPRKPSYIVIAIGVNDSRYLEGEPLTVEKEACFRQNIELVIDKARFYTENIVIVGLVLGDDSLLKPVPDGDGHCYDRERMEKFNSMLRQIALSHNLHLVDLIDKLLPCDFSDGLHPNQQGHNKMFLAIKEYL